MPATVSSVSVSTSPERAETARQGILLLLLSALVFVSGLGATHLWDDDETFFAEVAREMFVRGDFIVPWFNQELFAHKPPVMYWLMMGAFQLFGINEFSARLPAALFGIANVLLVWRLGTRLYSPRAGFWAGVALATSLNFVVIARAAACDSELVFFCTLAVFLFVRGTFPKSEPTAAGPSLAATGGPGLRSPGWGTWAAVYAAMGAAVLVKGPIGVLLPGCVLGMTLLLWRGMQESSPETRPASTAWLQSTVRSARWLMLSFHPWRVVATAWQMRPILAVATVLLVAGPWFAAVAWMTDGAFLHGFFGVHHFHRFTATMDNHAGPVWFYLAAICVGFFPWILLFRPAAIEWLRRFRDEPASRPADLLIVAWCVVWVGFFTLATTKFPHYVVPAYPALALFTGAFLAQWIRRPEICAHWRQRLMWVTLLLIGLGVIFVPLGVAAWFRIEARWLWAPGIPVVLAAVTAWYWGMRGEIRRAAVCLTGFTSLFLLLLFVVAAAEIDRHQCTVALARAVEKSDGSAPVRIASWRFFRPGLVYYAAEQIGVSRVEPLSSIEAVEEWFARPGQISYVVAREEEYLKEKDRLSPEIEVVASEDWFLKPGQRLLLLKQSLPPAGGVTTAGSRVPDVK